MYKVTNSYRSTLRRHIMFTSIPIQSNTMRYKVINNKKGASTTKLWAPDTHTKKSPSDLQICYATRASHKNPATLQKRASRRDLFVATYFSLSLSLFLSFSLSIIYLSINLSLYLSLTLILNRHNSVIS